MSGGSLESDDAWMVGIDIRRHAERFSRLSDRHQIGAARPGAHARFLVRQPLQLQLLVQGPLDALIIAQIAFALDEADERVEDEACGDEEAADEEDDDDAEGGEVDGVVCGADLLVVAHHL